ncbi:MAG: ComEA family DNA-binding protein, partial [Oligoflexia bacterium]|nr:ComEA family DNA-binding protein [Oligoflexia bacterium]
INTASASALEALPGIGPAKAAAIVTDRTDHGPFSSCQDLSRVTGIGAATVAKLAGRCAASAGQ